ncbi:MAG: flagellar basal body-associated FliL family protein [Acidimicrobiales bacterium]
MAKKKKAADADGEEEKKGKDPKMMAIGGLVVAGLVYQFVLKSPPAEDPAAAGGVAAVTTTVPMIEGEIFELPEMVLNIEDPDVTYLRIQFAVVLDELTIAKDFEKESAIAKDIIVDKLGSYSAAQLGNPAQRELLKEELSTEIRTAYGEAKVVRVLITSLVMQ